MLGCQSVPANACLLREVWFCFTLHDTGWEGSREPQAWRTSYGGLGVSASVG